MATQTFYLSHYLPYGLQMKCSGNFQPNTKEKPLIKGAHATLTGDLYADIENNTYGGLGVFTPVLRPCYDIFKTIEVNGKKFVPAKILWSVDAEEEEEFDLYGTIPGYWRDSMAVLMGSYMAESYRNITFLLEWHFDVFGLIDKGLAFNLSETNAL